MKRTNGFSIIELLVVVSIIVLLIGIILPAIGSARNAAYINRSQSNLRQLAAAHASYAAAHNDQQWSNIPHGLAQYGDDLNSAMTEYNSRHWGHPRFIHGKWWTDFGWARQGDHSSGALWGLNINEGAPPINFDGPWPGFGSFRIINMRDFNRFLDGRFFDATFYAPKDRAVISAIGECYDAPGEYCRLIFTAADQQIPTSPIYSSYVLSPAAMYNPEVFSIEHDFSVGDIFNMPAAFRAPTFSQAKYPNLKTHMLEHHWLQGPVHDCNPMVQANEGIYNGCQPYYFNGGIESRPVTLFYDGHVDILSVRNVVDANNRAIAQGGNNASLWHTGTPLEHYYHNLAYMQTGRSGSHEMSSQTSSYHIFTRDGIRGRDTIHVNR